MELYGISCFSIMAAIYFRVVFVQTMQKIKITQRYVISVLFLQTFYAFPIIIICIFIAVEADNYQIQIKQDILKVNVYNIKNK